MAEKPRYKYVSFERASSPLPAGTTNYTIAIDPTLPFNSGACLMLMSTAGWFLVNPAIEPTHCMPFPPPPGEQP